jgi:hypothetical protein
MDAACLGPSNCAGFHGLERDGAGKGFRWTSGAAVVLLPLPAGKSTVTIDIEPHRRYTGEDRLIIESAGVRHLQRLQGRCRISVIATIESREQPVRPTPVYLFSTTYRPDARVTRDRRLLGVSLSSITWRSL